MIDEDRLYNKQNLDTMKIKTLVVILLLSGGVTNAFAQNSCKINSILYHKAIKAENYKNAYKPWRNVLDNCPTLHYDTFTDGTIILKNLMRQIKDRKSADYKRFFNELLDLHDLYIKLTPEFHSKGIKIQSEDEALSAKAMDYITFAPKIDANQVYDWLNKSVNALKAKSTPVAAYYYFQMSLDKIMVDPTHKEQAIQDYLNATQYADEAIAAAESENLKKSWGDIKDNLVALFINSGMVNCESLQDIYGPKVEANQTDLTYLQKAIDVMKMMKCIDSDAYQQASFYVHKIQPTAETAIACAYRALRKGDIDDSMRFFDEAINLETDNVKKAEKAYVAASALVCTRKFSQSKAYVQKAIGFNENYAAPYILIANLYAMAPNWSDTPTLNKCTYFAVIDKLQKAKSVDPSIAQEIDRLIKRYASYIPTNKELYMLGYKSGEQIKIGGWIEETIKVPN